MRGMRIFLRVNIYVRDYVRFFRKISRTKQSFDNHLTII